MIEPAGRISNGARLMPLSTAICPLAGKIKGIPAPPAKTVRYNFKGTHQHITTTPKLAPVLDRLVKSDTFVHTAINAAEKNGPIHIMESTDTLTGGSWNPNTHEISVNPDKSISLEQTVAFEIFNASNSDRFRRLQQSARDMELEKQGVSPVKAADTYAIETERIEFESGQGTNQVMRELGLQDTVPAYSSDFIKVLADQIPGEHAGWYVLGYESMTGRQLGELYRYSLLNPVNLYSVLNTVPEE